MRMMWRIQAEMTNEGYNLHDLARKTLYQGNYMPDKDLYLPYRGR